MQTNLIEKATIHRRAPKGGVGSYQGGQFLPTDLWESEKKRARQALPDLLEKFGDRLQLLRSVYEQNALLEQENTTRVKLVPLTTLEAQMKASVREAYEQAYLLGKHAAGNLTLMNETDRAAVKKVRIDEFRYLRNFLQDMREQSGTMSYALRGNYYVMAARELFQYGFILGNQTQGRYLSWAVGPTEHCGDCLRFSRLGWLPVREFIQETVAQGFAPNSGKLECIGFACQCSIKEEFRN